MKHAIKKIFTFILFLFGASVAGAQTHAIVYTKLAVSTSGIGGTGVYGFSDDDATDSVWTALETTHSIGSDDVWQASKITAASLAAYQTGNYTQVANYTRSANALTPYKLAGLFPTGSVNANSGTITGLTMVPTVTLDTIGNTTTEKDLVTFTVPASAIRDGDMISLRYIVKLFQDTGMAGTEALATKIYVGDTPFTFDSSQGFGSATMRAFFTLHLVRVGDDLYFTPDAAHLKSSAPGPYTFPLLGGSIPDDAEGYGDIYNKDMFVTTGYAIRNGHVFTNVDFPAGLTIRMAAKWTASPGARTSIRILSARASIN